MLDEGAVWAEKAGGSGSGEKAPGEVGEVGEMREGGGGGGRGGGEGGGEEAGELFGGFGGLQELRWWESFGRAPCGNANAVWPLSLQPSNLDFEVLAGNGARKADSFSLGPGQKGNPDFEALSFRISGAF